MNTKLTLSMDNFGSPLSFSLSLFRDDSLHVSRKFNIFDLYL